MEFWGTKVKPGDKFEFLPCANTVVHLTHSCLGEVKGYEESVTLYAKVGNKKLPIGNLSANKFPQVSHDLVFAEYFELSHSSGRGSIYFFGHSGNLGGDVKSAKPFDKAGLVKSAKPDEDEKTGDGIDSDDGESFDEEEPTPTPKGRKRPTEGANKEATHVDKKAKLETSQKSGADVKKGGAVHQRTPYPKGGKTPARGGSKSNESLKSIGPVSCKSCSSDDGESFDEEEPTPTPKGRKRPTEGATKETTHIDKKAKLETSQKSDADDKKGGAVHQQTPYPKGGKTPATGGSKSNKSPKSIGPVSCNSCSRTFGSESALQAHSKAKHDKGFKVVTSQVLKFCSS